MITHTYVVGASIRRHFPHKGHSCSRAAAGTATARHYGTQQTGMRVQSMHDCLPVCACFIRVMFLLLGPACNCCHLCIKHMNISTNLHTPLLYTTHSLIHTVIIITTLKNFWRISACYRWSC